MARSFNGSSDFINSSTVFASAGACSISLWVNPAVGTGDPILIYNGNSGSNGFGLMIFSGNGGKVTGLLGGVAFINFTASPIAVGAWSHLLFVQSSGGSLWSLYVNGVFNTTLGGGPNAPSGVGVSIGASSGANFFNGSIEDPAIWSVSLAQGDATALAAGARPHTIRPASLVRFWPLDGLQSPEPDLSGNALNSTLTGTALAAGAPIAMFTSRRPQFLPPGVAPTVKPFPPFNLRAA